MDFVPRCTFTSIQSVCCMQTFDFGFWKLHARLSPVLFQGRFFVVVSSLSLIIYTLNLLIVLCTFIVYCVHLTYLCTILFFAAIFGFLETLFLENLIEIQKPLEKNYCLRFPPTPILEQISECLCGPFQNGPF